MTDIQISSNATIARVPVYCSAQDVADMLRLLDTDGKRYVFTETTELRKSQVEAYIIMAEDRIDEVTEDSFRTQISTDEYHDLIYPLSSVPRLETSVRLFHSDVRQLDATKGDKLELWTGSSWIDYLSMYTEGRGNQFWLDYKMGILYLTNVWMYSKLNGIRITYRWGKTRVPNDIREACAKMAAMKILDTDYMRVMIPQNPNAGLDRNRMIERWTENIDDILKQHNKIRYFVLTR